MTNYKRQISSEISSSNFRSRHADGSRFRINKKKKSVYVQRHFTNVEDFTQLWSEQLKAIKLASLISLVAMLLATFISFIN